MTCLYTSSVSSLISLPLFYTPACLLPFNFSFFNVPWTFRSFTKLSWLPNWLECFFPRPQLPSTLFLLLILQVSPELKPCSSKRLEGQVITQPHSIWRVLIGAGGGECRLGSHPPILLLGLPHTGAALLSWGTLTALGVLHISFLASPGMWRSGSR